MVLCGAPYSPTDSIEEPEAVLETAPAAQNPRRVEVSGRGEDSTMKPYGGVFYRWDSPMGTVYTPQEEVIIRFSDWDAKEPSPEPLVFEIARIEAYIYLQRLKSGKRVSIPGGSERGLKQGDKVWVDMFSYEHNKTPHKAARVFKLDENLMPVSEVFNLWYDEDTRSFHEVDGFQHHALTAQERFAVSWKMFWFGWISDLPSPEIEQLPKQHLERFVLDRLKQK